MAFRCKNMNGCSMYNFITSSVRIMQLQPFIIDYCTNSKNFKECARYKIQEKGGEPPPDLLPSGKIFKS